MLRRGGVGRCPVPDLQRTLEQSMRGAFGGHERMFAVGTSYPRGLRADDGGGMLPVEDTGESEERTQGDG